MHTYVCVLAGPKLLTEIPFILILKGARKTDPPSSEGILRAIFSRFLFYNKKSMVFLVDPSKAQRPLSASCPLTMSQKFRKGRMDYLESFLFPKHLAGQGKHTPWRSPSTAHGGVTPKGYNLDVVQGHLPTYRAPLMLSCLIMPGDLPVLAP